MCFCKGHRKRSSGRAIQVVRSPSKSLATHANAMLSCSHLTCLLSIQRLATLIAQHTPVTSHVLSRELTDKLRYAQEQDQELKNIVTGVIKYILKLKLYGDLLCDTQNGAHRLFIPTSLREAIFHEVHDVARPGMRATTSEVTKRFVWPGI